MTDERMLAMARRIAEQHPAYQRSVGYERAALETIALAAIKETTEAAIKLAEALPHVTRSPKSGVTVWGPSSVADALRNGEHLT